MWKSIIYKEWLKTRWLIGGLWLVALGLLGYIFISLGRIFNLLGMEHIWDVIINRHHGLFSEINYYPLAFGILLALAQFIPEMLKKRLKLTLHLPIPQKTAYFGMQIYGMSIILFSFLIQLTIFYFYSFIYFPKEIIQSTFFTLLPWYSAGLTAYIFTALICIEPLWIRRVFYALFASAVFYISYLSDYPGAYKKVWWIFLLIPTAIFSLPWLSVERFKKGIQ